MNQPDAIPIHRIRWYVWARNHDGAAVKLRHTATMRGLWGWDAECTCGWETRTGGATRGSVKREVWLHKWRTAEDEA